MLKFVSSQILGSGSDHAPFAFTAGVPALYYGFYVDKQKYPGLSGYPTYHTGFETFFLMEQLLDPGFRLARTCTQLALHMVRHIRSLLMYVAVCSCCSWPTPPRCHTAQSAWLWSWTGRWPSWTGTT